MRLVRAHIATCVFVRGRTRLAIPTLNLHSQDLILRQLWQEGWLVQRTFNQTFCHLEIRDPCV